MDRWHSSSQSPIKFEACRTSSRGRLFPFLGLISEESHARVSAHRLCADGAFASSPMDFRGISDFSVKATSAEIGRVSITISLCLDEYAQFCGGGRCWPIA
ncbi:hypothetical protein AGR13a_Lc100098 [Agrobacterium genomosp. 13 str. CFBP 6927]|uniref:Transposase n=1 Tax=Agrobacterium genomosp. 13 str. CFBP 6927 TaxID=1183428 RepID=A0ABM9VJ27_9HYPH|nr:hypothetical protein AGR13a_Lc100098 [Agrobacterium genomosp. 13 str. CFBP 6927]